MARYTAEVKYICSIYPGKLQEVSFHVGPEPEPNSPRSTKFFHPGVPKGDKPKVFEVTDAFENIMDVQQSTGRKKRSMSKLVPCDELVSNILRTWAGNMVDIPTGMGPGIMEIANSSPTTVEMQILLERQHAFFEHMFMKGERLALEKLVKELTEPMFLAAEWLGRKTNWASITVGTTVPCPVCREQIEEDAYICKNCGTKLKALPAHLQALNGQTTEPHTTGVRAPAIPPVIPVKPLPERPQPAGA